MDFSAGIAHPSIKNAKFRDFGTNLSIADYFVPLFSKNFLKISPCVKNFGASENTQKFRHPPLKKSIIEKNDLLCDKATQRFQTFVTGKAYVFVGMCAKRIPKKPIYSV